MNAETRAVHWDERYRSTGAERVSWFEPEPNQSLALVQTADAGPGASVIDIGGGASPLACRLVEQGYHDVSVLDISQEALDAAKARLPEPDAVTWIKADLLEWTPNRRWRIWHDRAVFHFLTEKQDRDTYRSLLRRAVEPGGAAIIATFSQTGPTSCSGLPVVRYSPDSLVTEIGPGFTPVDSGSYEHLTPAGMKQSFTWVVLRANQE